MAASALSAWLDNLERSWSALDLWMNFWTLLVVIGVAVELVVLVIEYVHERQEFKRGVIHPPDKPSVLLFGLGFLGAAFVAIGVAGEFRVHTMAGKIETDMRDVTSKLVALANGESAKANEHAGLANQKASEANERARNNEHKAALLIKQAAGLKRETAILYAVVSPRRLTIEEQASITASCRSFSGRIVTLSSYALDTEASALVIQISSSLREAGMSPIFVGTLFGTGTPVSGIRVSGPDRVIADAVELSLRHEGHLTTERSEAPISSTMQFGALTGITPAPVAAIFVGIKPISLPNNGASTIRHIPTQEK